MNPQFLPTPTMTQRQRGNKYNTHPTSNSHGCRREIFVQEVAAVEAPLLLTER